MFTQTTQQQKDNAPIQAPALNSTIWGGLASAVGAVGAATAGIFSAMNTTEWQVRVAIVAGIALVISVSLAALVALIRNDSRIRATASPAAGTAADKASRAAKDASQVAWVTPPSMHVYSNADPSTPLDVILVGVGKDKTYYVAAANGGQPETITSQQVAKVELAHHQFR